MNTIQPYVKRPVRFIKQVELNDWRLKIYGISAVSSPVSDEFVSNVVDKVLSHLPQPANTENCYGVGFLTIHVGVLRNWILLDWWGYEDILLHKLFSSPLDAPNSIVLEEETSIIACVHELRIINFESEAWIKTVLGKNAQPNLDEYMNQRFDKDDKIT